MYTVQFGSAIYVLHAFKKKAKKEMDLSKTRLEAALRNHNRRQSFMRCCALLKGILVLDEARMPELAGILAR